MQTTAFIWFDGKMVPWADAQVHVLTHALHYGSAVFEGIRAYACADGTSAVFRLKEHSQRLLNSAKILRLNIPYTVDEISQGILDTLKANKMKEGYIRPLSFVGDGEMGVYPGNNKVHTIIAVWPWGAYLGPEALEMGIRAKTSSFARMHVNTLMSKAKAAGNYVNSILAKIEAKEDGYDEAVMLDTNGFVSEATGENIFIVRDGILMTPPLGDGLLEGITRDTVLNIAVDMDIPALEETLNRSDLYVADEMFMTGSAAELTPIGSVDNRVIGKPGPITKALQERYFDVAYGKVPEYEEWITRIAE